MISLDTLPGDIWSKALDVNDAGQIVGISGTIDGSTHAVLWEDGRVMALGTLTARQQSGANNINNAGQIAGFTRSSSGEERAVFWQDGEIAELETFPWGASSAFAINNNGQIVGYSGKDGPVVDAVLWEDGQAQVLDELSTPSRPPGRWPTLDIALQTGPGDRMRFPRLRERSGD